MRLRLALALVCLSLGGCASTNLLGGSTPPPPLPQAAAPAKPNFVVPAGLGALSDADRQAAYDAEVGAVTDGKRRPWKGAKGVFGYVDPGAEETRDQGTCRKYAQTVYIAGRPKKATGLGCKQPDGQWKILS